MLFRIADHVSLTEVDNEMVLLDLNSGKYFGLNPVGSQILRFLDNNLSADEVSISIARHYHIELAVARKDVDALLEHMLDQGLIIQRKSG